MILPVVVLPDPGFADQRQQLAPGDGERHVPDGADLADHALEEALAHSGTICAWPSTFSKAVASAIARRPDLAPAPAADGMAVRLDLERRRVLVAEAWPRHLAARVEPAAIGHVVRVPAPCPGSPRGAAAHGRGRSVRGTEARRPRV
jgi:hypothetical protein